MHPLAQRLVVSIAFLLTTGCAIQSEFDKRYDHYFPKRGEYVNSDYRKSFDKFLFAPTPPEGMSSRSILLHRAFHGDSSAFHSFLHHPDRDGEGHFAEEWINECVVLLLKLGDDRFSQLLAKEDHATREDVGQAVDTQIAFKRDHFQKTRALYHFRWGPREPQ